MLAARTPSAPTTSAAVDSAPLVSDPAPKIHEVPPDPSRKRELESTIPIVIVL